MVTGRDLIENGWPEGPTIGLALAAAEKGSLDEAPMAYKDVETVVSLQGDLVVRVGRFTPKIVRMDAGGGLRRKKRK